VDDGITHLRNLLLSIDLFWGSLLSTLDSLLFCIFIIQPGMGFFKMGCSIKERGKVWKIRRFTDVFRCDKIIMLGGFHKEVARFRLVGQVDRFAFSLCENRCVAAIKLAASDSPPDCRIWIGQQADQRRKTGGFTVRCHSR